MHIEEKLMQSEDGARTYRIRIARPAQPPPPSGYPVLYVLDANAVFGTAAEAVNVQGRRSDKTGVAPSLVVGIGYPSEEPFPPDRHYDFTLESDPSALPSHPRGAQWPPQGGARQFLAFLEHSLKPAIAQDFSVDARKQTLFGHSLGGLFTLYALFAAPGTFRTYIAGSPSVHWNKDSIRAEEAAFAARGDAEDELRLLIAVGSLEENHKSRMVDHARELSERLAALGRPDLHVEFRSFEDDNHVSLLPGLISRAIRFAGG
ncbi:alpha/beta hydrolase [Cohnella hongkongensis]|uniref:Alpha/beta hydrolase n=1 Tax=Cohnella hongkongensis TaxID=178337 RepID=A0ABV9FIL2_9BACL